MRSTVFVLQQSYFLCSLIYWLPRRQQSAVLLGISIQTKARTSACTYRHCGVQSWSCQWPIHQVVASNSPNESTTLRHWMAPLFGSSQPGFPTKVNNGYGSCSERGSFHEPPRISSHPGHLWIPYQTIRASRGFPPSTPTVLNLGWHSTHHGASWEDIPGEPETKGWLSVVFSHGWAQALKVKPQRPGAQIQENKGVVAGMFTVFLAACYCPIDDHQRL